MAVIPDIPEEIDIQQKRTEFIVRKLIDKVEDDNTADYVGTPGPIDFQKYPLSGGTFKHSDHFFTGNMK
jgi:hypothetical protein